MAVREDLIMMMMMMMGVFFFAVFGNFAVCACARAHARVFTVSSPSGAALCGCRRVYHYYCFFFFNEGGFFLPPPFLPKYLCVHPRPRTPSLTEVGGGLEWSGGACACV